MSTAPTPKLQVGELWKIYGANAERLIGDRNSAPDDAFLEKHGLFGAVRGVSFDVMPGELITLMGLSGSGKSTLLRAVSRLIEPSYGTLLIDGQDFLGASSQELINIRRHRLGMVFQHYALLPHRTVLENVALPLEVRGETLPSRIEKARRTIDLVGLGKLIGRYPSQLSGGQQQRVGIARSLVTDPDIWFLDEPFSALDPLIRRELQQELLRLQKIVNKTILFVTHDFDEAVRLATRIIVMEAGRIVQIGTPEDIVLRPKNAYIEAFTRNIPKANVVTIGAIARPAADETLNGVLPAQARIVDAAPQIIASSGTFGVETADGHRVGVIGTTDILPFLFSSPEKQAA
ncbi:ATP-binding cassette domain-containing protein [Acetobacter estunensis]|uniref:ATP-binding cassette domain-containing protein n=1 Tax=Acetobacter estunensis TaxID=104097 RepID=UPI001C2DA3FC|nr:ATP-binding cassette domain-containing protein [Acetobacter estunensis]MBV1837869.1 ATP-binding cassette domain-containing protein [Acetobacter estunensis]